MASVTKVELRKIDIGQYTITAAFVYFSGSEYLSNVDIKSGLDGLSGGVVNGTCHMYSTYPGFDENVGDIDVTDGHLRLVQSASYSGLFWTITCALYYDNTLIGIADSNYGYASTPEFQPLLVFVNSSGKICNASGYTGPICYNNGNSDITVIASDGTYHLLLSSSTPATVYNAFNVANLTETSETPDDMSELVVESTDPYEKGAGKPSKPGGGHGTFTDDDETTPLPPLPSLSAVDTGLITLYNPTESELQALGDYLWSPLFDMDTLKKLFSNPMDAILGLSIIPVTPATSAATALKIGNVATSISMKKVTNQFVRVDCGTLSIKEYWGAYLDYSPYTKAEIYLPFIGTHELNIDDIMDKDVHVVYTIDVLSGALFCHVFCAGKTIYNFIGQCSCSVPISAQDWTQTINGVLSIAGNIGMMVATGGATAPLAIPGMASTAVNSLKPAIEKSGALSGMGGLLGYRKPFLLLTRPQQAIPANQNKYMGYPAFITKTLGLVHGYCEVEHIELGNIDATYEEYQEIYALLEKGVIL